MEKQIFDALHAMCDGKPNQEDIAKSLGISRPYLNRLLNKKRPIDGITLQTLRKIFPGVTLNLHGGAAASGDPDDPLLTELLTHWPRLTRGEQAKVVALAIDLLEKKGSAVQSEILDRGVVGK